MHVRHAQGIRSSTGSHTHMSHTHTHTHTHTCARACLTSVFIVFQARKQLLSPHVAGPPRHSQKPEGVGEGALIQVLPLQPFSPSALPYG